MPANSVLFIGSKQLGLQVLRTMHRRAPRLLVGSMTIDDRTDRRSAHDGFVDFCAAQGLPLFVVPDRQQAEQTIARLQPDLCIVVGWYWLITDHTLRSVPRGFVGIHNSKLPAYRGGSPLALSHRW